MAEVAKKSETIEKTNEVSDSEDGDESMKENEGADESLDNISKSKRTPLKTLPLLDSPLTQSGKRIRTQTQQIYKVEEKEEFVYEFKGSGVALGEIPYIGEMINRESADDLKKLHSICFGRIGDRHIVKKNLRQFNGLPFDASDKKRYEEKKNRIDRIFVSDLGKISKILGLEVSGSKPDRVDRILAFVLKPVDHGKNLPGKKKKKSKSKKKKSDKGKKRGRKSKGGDTENDSTANDENDSTANDENDSTADDTADSSDSESEAEEKPAKKPVKTPARKTPAKKAPAKKTPAKKTPAKKTPAKRSKDVVESDSDSSDDEPLIKKTKAAPEPPTNDELKEKIEKILDGANLEEISMKAVIKEVYEMYPGFDLTERKSFIKETVKAVIS